VLIWRRDQADFRPVCGQSPARDYAGVRFWVGRCGEL